MIMCYTLCLGYFGYTCSCLSLSQAILAKWSCVALCQAILATWSCFAFYQAILAIHDHVLPCVKEYWLHIMFVFITLVWIEAKQSLLMYIFKYLVCWLKQYIVLWNMPTFQAQSAILKLPCITCCKSHHTHIYMYVLHSFKLKLVAHTLYTSLIIAITPALWTDSWVVCNGHLWRKRLYDSGWTDWILHWC